MDKKIILVVDDIKINRIILKNILKLEYDILEATNGREALEIIKHNKVHGILLDLNMPIMNGFEFLVNYSQIKDSDKCPVIAITGDESMEAEEKSLSYGADDFLTKPFKSNIVISRLNLAIKLKEVINEAKRDSLTRLFNRNTTRKKIDSAINILKESTQKGALFIVDIDDFKDINDSYGHNIGDEVLIKIANSISEVCDDYGIVGRIGGDEFIIFINRITRENKIEHILNDLMYKLNNIVIESIKNLKVTCSVGVAIFPNDGIDRMGLYKNADLALYDAKNKGKGIYSFYKKNSSVERRNVSRGYEWILDVLEFSIFMYDIESKKIHYMNSYCRNKVSKYKELSLENIYKSNGIEVQNYSKDYIDKLAKMYDFDSENIVGIDEKKHIIKNKLVLFEGKNSMLCEII